MELRKYSIQVSVLLALKSLYNIFYDEFFKGLKYKEKNFDQWNLNSAFLP